MDLPLVARTLGTLLLSPPACAACDAPVPHLVAFCRTCVGTIVSSGDPLVVGRFGGALATAVHRLKFGDRPDLARPLGALLAARCRGAGLSRAAVDLVVPVPLGLGRLARRGYNQSALLASRIARGLEVDALRLGLTRLRETSAQAELGREGREENVRGAFAPRGSRLEGRRVLLVDDVRTTGATLRAAARAVALGGGTVVAEAVVAEA